MKKLFRLLILFACMCGLVSWIIAEYTWASYPGGKPAMEKFIRDSLRYPESEKAKGLEAIVSVGFDITKEGKVSNPTARFVIGNSDGFLQESKRLALSMPQWNPATKNGRPAPDRSSCWVYFELPDSLVHLPPASADTTVYKELDTVPEFPGGLAAMHTFLNQTIRYPQMEKEQGKMGTVYVSYTIEKNGKVSNVHIHKEVEGAPGLSKESIRVVSSFPRHTPAIKNGKAVRFEYIIPVRFTLI